ncbi:MAG: thioredoxin-disulfide reductase [Oligoflexia bacterium]|nr:thioredoxin-disulfide reductase [Oligoflexia bacterium]
MQKVSEANLPLNCDIAIIGSGPAGYTAAIYTARAGLALVVIEGAQPGGQLTMTTMIENFPGFPEGIMGPELMDRMRSQASHFGAKFISSQVTDLNVNQKILILDNGQHYVYKSLIIASGASSRWIGLPNEQQLIGRGVSSCATCDGFFYRDKIVHVVGGGDTALEDAIFLTKFARKVYLVHRREELRASKFMQSQAKANPKIEFIWNSVVDKILSDEQGVTAIVIKNLKSGEVSQRPTDGLFVAIGHIPNTTFLHGQLDTDSNGFIITHHGTNTNVDGVFACGDVQDPHYRQAISAAGSGCMAAISAEKYLSAFHSQTT